MLYLVAGITIDIATSSDPRQRRIGLSASEHIEETLYSLALLPMTKRLNMSLEAVQDLVHRAAQDARNPQLKAYFPLYVLEAPIR